MGLDADGRVRVFWSFLCREMSLTDSCYLSFLFPSSKMKRAGTTGSARGMALYEEEVSTKGVSKPQSGSTISFLSCLAPSFFLLKPLACQFTTRGVPLCPRH